MQPAATSPDPEPDREPIARIEVDDSVVSFFDVDGQIAVTEVGLQPMDLEIRRSILVRDLRPDVRFRVLRPREPGVEAGRRHGGRCAVFLVRRALLIERRIV
jgi:hypothetical protein